MGATPQVPVGAAYPTMGTVEPNPGLDMLLDDIFPNPELVPQSIVTTQTAPQSQPQPGTVSSSPAEPQATTPPAQPSTPSFFLQTQTGTVYKTAQDAIRGT